MSGATLTETLALSQISSDLAPSGEDAQHAIERVTALGFAPRLGSLLIRLKGANDAPSYNAALQLLVTHLNQIAKRKNWGHPNRIERVANEALRFYLLDMCTECDGRGILAHSYSGPAEEDAGNICPGCHGTTKASRDIRKRAGAIFKAGDIPSRLEAILNEADAILGRAERIATGVSRTKLYGD